MDSSKDLPPNWRNINRVEKFSASQVGDLGLDDAGSGVSTAEEGATTDDDNNCEAAHNSDEGYEDATLMTDVNTSSKPKRVLVFTTLTLIGLLAMCRNGSVDGTFKSMTKMFKQLFIMMVNYEGPFVPIAFGWLPNKHTESYHIFLLLLLNKFKLENRAVFQMFGRSKLKLKKITLDFEVAIHKAFGCIFKLRGCFFHYSQAGWRVVQKEGMVVTYITVKEFRDFVRSVIAIAFLPLNLIEGVIDELRAIVFDSTSQCVKKMTSFQATFLDYIESVWLYGNYQPKMWNQWKRTKNLTNNNNEGMAISSFLIFYSFSYFRL